MGNKAIASIYVYSLDIASFTMAINVWLRPGRIGLFPSGRSLVKFQGETW